MDGSSYDQTEALKHPNNLPVEHNLIPYGSVGTMARGSCPVSLGDDHVARKSVTSGMSTGFQIIAVFSCMMSVVLPVGLGFGFSVVYAQLIREFDEDRSTIALVMSIYQALTALGGVLWGYPVSKLGYGYCIAIGGAVGSAALIGSSFATNIPTLIVLVGCVTGASFGILCLGPFVVAGSISKKYNTAIIAFVSTGSSVGQFTLAALIETLIEQYNWNGTFFVVGAVCLHSIPIGLILNISEKLTHTVNRTHTPGDVTTTAKNHFYKVYIFKQPMFWLLMLNSFILGFSAFAESRFLVDLTILKGFERQTGSFFIQMIGIGNLAGGLVGSISKVACGFESTGHMVYWILILAATHVLVIFMDTYVGILITSLLNGLCFGNIFAHVAVALYELYGQEGYASIFAFWNIFLGVGSFLGGLCGGIFHDKTGSYDLLFEVCVGLNIVYALSFLLIFIRRRREATSMLKHKS